MDRLSSCHWERRMKRNRGFSLMELLIVVTVILIIAAIAVPKFVEMKRQATATAAVANLKSLNNALAAFNSQYADVGYPPSLTALGPTTAMPSSTLANLVDESLASCTTIPKQGYSYAYTATGTGSLMTAYTINANPISINVANRYFFTDQGLSIRYSDGSAASVNSPPIGQ
jgi:type IV pilus assembly protein PilA